MPSPCSVAADKLTRPRRRRAVRMHRRLATALVFGLAACISTATPSAGTKRFCTTTEFDYDLSNSCEQLRLINFLDCDIDDTAAKCPKTCGVCRMAQVPCNSSQLAMEESPACSDFSQADKTPSQAISLCSAKPDDCPATCGVCIPPTPDCTREQYVKEEEQISPPCEVLTSFTENGAPVCSFNYNLRKSCPASCGLCETKNHPLCTAAHETSSEANGHCAEYLKIDARVCNDATILADCPITCRTCRLTPNPTEAPTTSPSKSPSASPSTSPSNAPTSPTSAPSSTPTGSPSFAPSQTPTLSPTVCQHKAEPESCLKIVNKDFFCSEKAVVELCPLACGLCPTPKPSQLPSASPSPEPKAVDSTALVSLDSRALVEDASSDGKDDITTVLLAYGRQTVLGGVIGGHQSTSRDLSLEYQHAMTIGHGVAVAKRDLSGAKHIDHRNSDLTVFVSTVDWNQNMKTLESEVDIWFVYDSADGSSAFQSFRGSTSRCKIPSGGLVCSVTKEVPDHIFDIEGMVIKITASLNGMEKLVDTVEIIPRAAPPSGADVGWFYASFPYIPVADNEVIDVPVCLEASSRVIQHAHFLVQTDADWLSIDHVAQPGFVSSSEPRSAGEKAFFVFRSENLEVGVPVNEKQCPLTLQIKVQRPKGMVILESLPADIHIAVVESKDTTGASFFPRDTNMIDNPSNIMVHMLYDQTWSANEAKWQKNTAGQVRYQKLHPVGLMSSLFTPYVLDLYALNGHNAEVKVESLLFLSDGTFNTPDVLDCANGPSFFPVTKAGYSQCELFEYRERSGSSGKSSISLWYGASKAFHQSVDVYVYRFEYPISPSDIIVSPNVKYNACTFPGKHSTFSIPAKISGHDLRLNVAPLLADQLMIEDGSIARLDTDSMLIMAEKPGSTKLTIKKESWRETLFSQAEDFFSNAAVVVSSKPVRLTGDLLVNTYSGLDISIEDYGIKNRYGQLGIRTITENIPLQKAGDKMYTAVHARFEDGTSVLLGADEGVSLTSSESLVAVIDNDGLITAPNNVVSGTSEIRATWRAPGCEEPIRGSTMISAVVPTVVSLAITTDAELLTDKTDVIPHLHADVAVSTELVVTATATLSDGSKVDVSSSLKLVPATTASGVSWADYIILNRAGGAYSMTTLAGGQSGIVDLTLAFEGAEASTTIRVVRTGSVKMIVTPYPSYQGSLGRRVTSLAPIKGGSVYQSAQIHCSLVLTDTTVHDCSGDDVIFTPTSEVYSIDQKSHIVTYKPSGSEGNHNGRSHEVQATLEWKTGKINADRLTIELLNEPVEIKMLQNIRIVSPSSTGANAKELQTLSGVTNDVAGIVEVGAKLSDGTEVENILDPQGGLIGIAHVRAGLKSVQVLDPTKGLIAVAMNSNPLNLENANVIVECIAYSCQSIGTFIPTNLQPRQGDIDIGHPSGQPLKSINLRPSFEHPPVYKIPISVGLGQDGALGVLDFEISWASDGILCADPCFKVKNSVNGLFTHSDQGKSVRIQGNMLTRVPAPEMELGSIVLKYMNSPGLVQFTGKVRLLKDYDWKKKHYVENPTPIVAGRVLQSITENSEKKRREGGGVMGSGQNEEVPLCKNLDQTLEAYGGCISLIQNIGKCEEAHSITSGGITRTWKVMCPSTCGECYTMAPSLSPTTSPTASPSMAPTSSPSQTPTSSPSATPSSTPTEQPSENPTVAPSGSPSSSPTLMPSPNPTARPTAHPSASPSTSPSYSPSVSPTSCFAYPEAETCKDVGDPFCSGPYGDSCPIHCGFCKSKVPTPSPSHLPTTSLPTRQPTFGPSTTPTSSPSLKKDQPCSVEQLKYESSLKFRNHCLKHADCNDIFDQRVFCPMKCGQCSTPSPSLSPSNMPTSNPSDIPTAAPTGKPSQAPSGYPTAVPSAEPSAIPTLAPTTSNPTFRPTSNPSESPTPSPTGCLTKKDPSLCQKSWRNSDICKHPMINSMCPIACGTCSKPTTSTPTSATTNPPSLFPSATPTTLARVPSEPSRAPSPKPVVPQSPTKSPTPICTELEIKISLEEIDGHFCNQCLFRDLMPEPDRIIVNLLCPFSCGVCVSIPPSAAPTSLPTTNPSNLPTASPTDTPSLSPTFTPTSSPSGEPTGTPTAKPSVSPTPAPTNVADCTPFAQIWWKNSRSCTEYKCDSAPVQGDVNGDCVFNIADVDAVLAFTMDRNFDGRRRRSSSVIEGFAELFAITAVSQGSQSYLEKAMDTNGDGVISLSDAEELRSILSGDAYKIESIHVSGVEPDSCAVEVKVTLWPDPNENAVLYLDFASQSPISTTTLARSSFSKGIHQKLDKNAGMQSYGGIVKASRVLGTPSFEVVMDNSAFKGCNDGVSDLGLSMLLDLQDGSELIPFFGGDSLDMAYKSLLDVKRTVISGDLSTALARSANGYNAYQLLSHREVFKYTTEDCKAGKTESHCGPSHSPTTSPSENPTLSPSLSPSTSPTIQPSKNPSTSPTPLPSSQPSLSPSAGPSKSPSRHPSSSPSLSPSGSPSTPLPSSSPSISPSVNPTNGPIATPTTNPTPSPSTSPTPKYDCEDASGCQALSMSSCTVESAGKLTPGIAQQYCPIMCTKSCPPKDTKPSEPLGCLDKSGCNNIDKSACTIGFVAKSCPFTCGTCTDCADEWSSCESLSCSGLGALVTKCKKTCGLCGYSDGNDYYKNNPTAPYVSCTQDCGVVASDYTLGTLAPGDQGCNAKTHNACADESISVNKLPFSNGKSGRACQKYCLDKGYTKFALLQPKPIESPTCSCCNAVSSSCHGLEKSECRGGPMYSGLPSTLRPNTNGEYTGFPVEGLYEEDGFLLGGECQAAVYCTNGTSCSTSDSNTGTIITTTSASSGDNDSIWTTGLIVGVAIGAVAFVLIVGFSSHVHHKGKHSGTFHCEHEYINEEPPPKDYENNFYSPQSATETFSNPLYSDTYNNNPGFDEQKLQLGSPSNSSLTPELAGEIEWDENLEQRDFQRSLTTDGPKLTDEQITTLAPAHSVSSFHGNEENLMSPDIADSGATLYDRVMISSEELNSIA